MGLALALMVLVGACSTDDGATTTSAAPSTTGTQGEDSTSAPPATETSTSGAPDTTSVEPGEPYQIGGMSDQTGGFSSIGVPVMNGLRAAVEEVNAQGGVGGHEITLIVRDDQSTPEVAVSNVREFDSLGVSAIVGVNSSAAASAAAPLVAELSLPLIGHGIASDLLQPVQPFIFMTQADFADQARAQIALVGELASAGEVPEAPRVALLYYSTPAGEAWHDAAVSAAGEIGLEVVESQSAQIGFTDISSQITRIRDAEPDAIAVFMNSAGVTPVVGQMLDSGIDESTYLIGFQSTTLRSYMRDLDWDNFVSLAVYRDVTSAAAEGPVFDAIRAGAEAFGAALDDPGFVSGYVEGLVVIDALERCGFPCPGSEMRDAVEGLNSDFGGLAFAPNTFTPERHSAVTAVQFFRYSEDTDELVEVGPQISIAD